MVPRRFVRLAIVDAVGRVHAHLTPPALEDQPTRTPARRILDVGPAEDIAKECARCGGIVGINQSVDAGDHQTERLKSPPIILFGSIANQETVHRTGDRISMIAPQPKTPPRSPPQIDQLPGSRLSCSHSYSNQNAATGPRRGHRKIAQGNALGPQPITTPPSRRDGKISPEPRKSAVSSRQVALFIYFSLAT